MLRDAPRFLAAVSGSGPIRVLRLVSRLIVGGPAHNVCLLTANLERREFTSWLACGRTAQDERSQFRTRARDGD